MKTLKIDSKNGYLNLEDLPHNCIFNKVVTGCGGTTVALFNSENYIISVPTTELIINKTGLTEAGLTTITNYEGKKQTVFALFGNFTYQVKKALKEYSASSGTKKIMCTYNKMQQLINYLNPEDFRLLVDEYHILLKAYSYRDEAINGILNTFLKYKSYCFMSATPISAEFTPSMLNNAELVEAKWDEVDTLIVKLDQTNHPYMKAANYINAYKKDGYIEANGKKSREAFFFINSVTDIAEILKYCKLANDEVKIVCADTESNRRKLEGYTISNSRSENKPFTFITSKSFEGADYFSDSAICFVVSNSSNKNTLLDISTDIYQIAGRIRTAENPFRNMLIHIFNTMGKRKLELDITYEEMVAKVNDNINGANEIINLINQASDKAKNMAEKMINTEYVMKLEDGTYCLNDMIVKLDLYNFKLEQMIYKSGVALRKEYNYKGVLTTEIEYEQLDGFQSIGKKMSFKDAFLKYVELNKQIMIDESDLEVLVKDQPLIVPAYHKLGVDKVKKLRYVKSAIENALINLESDKTTELKLAKMITGKINLGFVSSKKAKEIIASAYKELDIKDTAKASDLSRWFDCKMTTKKIDGKSTKGYEIYCVNFKIK